VLTQVVFSAELQVILLFLTTGLLLAGIGQMIRNLQFERVHKCFLVLARFFRWEVYPKNGGLAGVYMQLPNIKGFYRGKQCNVLVFAKGSGRLRNYYTTFKIRVNNPQDRSLSILREDFYQKVNKWIGKQDISIDDPELDDFFILRSDDPLFVKSFIDTELKAQLKKNHLALNGSISLQGHELIYTERNLLTNAHDIRRFSGLIQLMLCMAVRLEAFDLEIDFSENAHIPFESEA